MRHRSRLQRLQHALTSGDQASQLRRITLHYACVLPGDEEYIVPPLPDLDSSALRDDISFVIADDVEADGRETAERDYLRWPTYHAPVGTEQVTCCIYPGAARIRQRARGVRRVAAIGRFRVLSRASWC